MDTLIGLLIEFLTEIELSFHKIYASSLLESVEKYIKNYMLILYVHWLLILHVRCKYFLPVVTNGCHLQGWGRGWCHNGQDAEEFMISHAMIVFAKISIWIMLTTIYYDEKYVNTCALYLLNISNQLLCISSVELFIIWLFSV